MEQMELQKRIEKMQNAAENVLQRDAAFFEALYALKTEIDGDARVQTAMQTLRDSGRSAFASFVPRIRFRVRTEEGMVGLPRQNEPVPPPAGKLDENLRDAASAVILNSAHRTELNTIVSEAIECDHTFEEIASEIEEAGYQIVVCLDFSAYTQIRTSTNYRPQKPASSGPQSNLQFSPFDLKFLRGMKIDAGA
jgi:hypothetical protein